MSSDQIRKVGPRGQITIPAEQRKNLGLTPGSEVLIHADGDGLTLREWGRSALRKRWSRRAWIRCVGETLAYVAAGASIEDLRESWSDKNQEQEQKLLLLLSPASVSQSIGLIPAANHPFLPLPPGEFYPIERSAAEAFRHCFYRHTRFIKLASGFPQLQPEDDVVLFGSQVSNVDARFYLGLPTGEAPKLIIEPGHKYRANLTWNLHTPSDADIRTIVEYGLRWESKGHQFVSSAHGEAPFFSTYDQFDNRSIPKEDYLLFTCLPRSDRRNARRVMIAAGLHGPGTDAIRHLLNAPPFKELEKAAKALEGAPWYQLLFHVRLKRAEISDLTEMTPSEIRLVGAKPILVSWC